MERESDILHEAGRFWVRKELYAYVVYENGITHAESIQAFQPDTDGLSLAKAYCDYRGGTYDRKIAVNRMFPDDFTKAINGG